MSGNKPVTQQEEQIAKWREEAKPHPALVWWDSKPQMPQVPPGVKNLIGAKAGKMTVVGFWSFPSPRAKSKGKRMLWVAACSCGTHEVRSSKAMTNPLNISDRCFKCRYVEYMTDQG